MDTTIPPTPPPPAQQYRLNPYIGIDNQTFADPRLTFVSAGVLAVIVSLEKSEDRLLHSVDTLPHGYESKQEIDEALTRLASLGYLIPKP